MAAETRLGKMRLKCRKPNSSEIGCAVARRNPGCWQGWRSRSSGRGSHAHAVERRPRDDFLWRRYLISSGAEAPSSGRSDPSRSSRCGHDNFLGAARCAPVCSGGANRRLGRGTMQSISRRRGLGRRGAQLFTHRAAATQRRGAERRACRAVPDNALALLTAMRARTIKDMYGSPVYCSYLDARRRTEHGNTTPPSAGAAPAALSEPD